MPKRAFNSSRREFIKVAACAPFVLHTLSVNGNSSSCGANGWPHLAAILKRITPPVFPDLQYTITDFGAIGNGMTDALPALTNAIRACNLSGGGKVIIPKGTWLMNGPILLTSNIHLHLMEGSVISFGSDAAYYLPPVLTRWEGTELYNYSPLIYSYQAVNVAISGKGTIDGRAKENFAKWKPLQKPAQDALRRMGDEAVPVNKREFGKDHWLRPPMIQFFGCKNVLVEGVKIVDSPFWLIHPVYCQNVIIRGIYADSHNANNDGVDPDSSVDVLIEDCTFNTGDDAVAIKSGRDRDGWRVGQPSENIVIRNCELSSRANGLCIGSEVSGGIRNVYMENCRIGEVESAVYFKSNRDRGGIVEQVYVRDIRVRKSEALIRFTNNYHSHRGGHRDTIFRGFSINKVSCEEALIVIDAVGLPETPLEDIRISAVSVASAHNKNKIVHTKNFIVEDVKVNWSE